MTQGRIHQLFEAGVITAQEAADWVFQDRWLRHYKSWCRNWKFLVFVFAVALGYLSWKVKP